MSDAPALHGVSHLSLSVRDLDRSLAFYRDMLGLVVVVGPNDGVVFEGRQAMVAAGRVVVSLQEHAANAGERFDPARTGLDHLAFHVSDHEELARWQEELGRRGVPCSEVKEVTGFGWMIELRDPDDIQLELFATK